MLDELKVVWGYVQEGGWDFEDFNDWFNKRENRNKR